jgi:hypothetical protein
MHDYCGKGFAVELGVWVATSVVRDGLMKGAPSTTTTPQKRSKNEEVEKRDPRARGGAS